MIIIESAMEGNERIISVEPPYFIDRQEDSIFICKLGEPIDSYVDLLAEYDSEERAKEVMGEIKEHVIQMQWLKHHGNCDVAVSEVGWIDGNKMLYTMPSK